MISIINWEVEVPMSEIANKSAVLACALHAVAHGYVPNSRMALTDFWNTPEAERDNYSLDAYEFITHRDNRDVYLTPDAAEYCRTAEQVRHMEEYDRQRDLEDEEEA